MPLFDIDDDGWIAQNKGRDPWELVREALQNAMDTESDISVAVNTRKRQVVVKDHGEGFEDLSDAWTVYGGTKGDDPTKRGRFSRGLKELIAGAQTVKVFSTSGSVEFDVIGRERIDLGRTISTGTKVVIENSDWTKDEFDEMKEYLKKIWAPEGTKILYNLQGGSNEKHERYEPDLTREMRLRTVKYVDQQKETPYRNTDVHIKRAEGGNGRIYEMGIPVKLNCDFPFWVDVQQRIPMANQRNEPDSQWFKKFKTSLLNMVYKNLSGNELREQWVQEALGEFSCNDSVKEYYTQEVVQDDRKAGTVVQSDEASDDKMRNRGYQVVNPDNYGASAAEAVRHSLPSSKEVAKDQHERNEQRVEPTPEQEEFVEFANEVAETLEHGDVTFEFWNIEPSYEGDCPRAEHQGDGTIRLNTFNETWEDVNVETLGTLVHEISHEQGFGHNAEWYGEMQRNFAELLVEHSDFAE